MAKKNFVVPIIALLSVLGMTGCEKAAPTSAPSIGENGNWWVDGTDTGVAAQGPKGDTGASPTISINEDGYWVINGTATDVKAEGTAGAPGQTPSVSINADGFWVINGVATDVSAQGPKGDPGTTPTVSINADGYWVINGVATEVKAEGSQGAPGSSPTVEIGIDDCWWINGVSTGMPAVAHDGNPGAPGAPGDPGATGPEGKSAFEIFMEHYPHYTGTEADWIKGVADGTLAANMPKAGHSGDWHYNPEKGKIERTCDVCGDVETKDAVLPEFASFAVTDSSMDGFFEVINNSTYPWTFVDGVWKSGNKGVQSSDSLLKVKALIAPSTFTFHVHASGEGSSDYFHTGVGIGGSTSLGGNHIGTPSGGDADVTFTIQELFSGYVEGSLIFHKDSSVDKGDDEAVVTNLMFNVPVALIGAEHIPTAVVVNFDSANGDADTQQVIWSGMGVNLPTPTRAGYVFDGWFADEGCTIPAPATFDADCTLHAKWVVAHKVTIVDMTPGADDVTVTVAHNGTLDIEEPADDEKLFGGFYLAPSCVAGTEFDITSPIKRDTIIYCKWNDAPAYTGTYGGANVWNANFTSGRTLNIAPNGTMTGYYNGTVSGINDEDGSLIVTGTSDKLYVVDDMIIGVSAYGSDSDMYIFVKGKEAYSSADNPFIVNTGISSDGSTANYNGRLFSIDRGGDVTNYCIFGTTLYKNVTVSSLDDDFVIGASADTYGKDICIKDENGDVITTQIKRKSVDADYGVYTDEDSHELKVYGDGSTMSLAGEMITYTKEGGALTYVEYSERKQVTSYAAYSSSTMTWDADKGLWVYKSSSYSSSQDTTYTDSSIVWRKENSKFVYGNDVIAGKVYITLSGDTFEISRPTFTVTTHIGSSEQSTIVRDGCSYILPTPVVEANQAFLGWYTNGDYSGDPVTEMTTSGDVYAKIVTTYNMTVHKNLTDDPTVSEVIPFNEETMMNPPTVMKEGYSFKGWFTDADCTVEYVPAAASADVEIWAKWEAGKYANNAANFLDAVDLGGTFIQSIDYGTTHSWKTATKNGEACICADNVQDTTDSVFKFVAKTDLWFSFDFITSSEANFDYLNVFVDDGTVTHTRSSVPAKTTKGIGTNTIEGTGSISVFAQAGQTVTLVYTKDSSYKLDNTVYLYNLAFEAPESVTVTYHYNDGETADKAVSGTKKATFTPETPERENYAFLGWFTDELLTEAFDSTKALTGDVDLYAKWYDLSAAVGMTKGDAVEINISNQTDVAADYTSVMAVPGQTQMWFKFTTDESFGAHGGNFYITADDATVIKPLLAKVEIFEDDATEAKGSTTSFYPYSPTASSRIYASSLSTTAGEHTYYVCLTFNNLASVAGFNVVWYGY